MNNIKKLQFFILFLFIVGCGYTPVLLNQSYNISLNNINFNGDEEVNDNILSSLNRSVKGGDKIYNLSVATSKVKTTLTKDEKGDPKIFQMEVIADVIILDEKFEHIKEITFNKKNTYNNINDKFELDKFEEIMIQNLSNNISNDILLKINNLNR